MFDAGYPMIMMARRSERDHFYEGIVVNLVLLSLTIQAAFLLLHFKDMKPQIRVLK